MREFKLYKLKLYKTKNGLMGVQDYLNEEALKERYFNDEEETGRTTRAGNPVISGRIYFETETFPEAFLENPVKDVKTRYYYDILVEEDDKGKKSIKECVLITEKTDVILATVSDVMRPKNPKPNQTPRPFVIFGHTVPVEALDASSNKDDFIDFMATRGLNKQEKPYNDNYQFSGFYTLFENQITLFAPLARKLAHYQMSTQTKDGKTYISNINPNPVFADGPITIKGSVTGINENMVTVERSADYETMKAEGIVVATFLANEVSVDENYIKTMVFELNVESMENVVVGENVSFVLDETSFKKIQTPRISVKELQKADDIPMPAPLEVLNDKEVPAPEASNELSPEEMAGEMAELESKPEAEAPKADDKKSGDVLPF